MFRKILVAVILILLAGIAALYWLTRPLPVLTVTTWAGDYGRAQAAAQMHPYAAANRVDVRLAQWDGQLSGLKGDVVDFELPRAVEACRKGLLEKIDPATLPAGSDGSPALKDFVPGAFGPCWVGSIVYSQVIITAPGSAAKTLADFFDTTKFPGKRALKRGSGKYNLEMALLADGVPESQIYATLSTDAGMGRALHKLASLGADLIWYDRGSEAMTLIHEHSAAFATALNKPVFDAAQQGDAPGVIWDHQLYEFDVFGVPAGNPKKDMAMDYIRFATGAAPLAGVASWVPYGPARRSAWGMVGHNPDLHIDMRPFLPTSHFETAFAVDDTWWLANKDRVDAAWRAWLANLSR
jgi:putative spermidine/putrescine transport system substrate-binding protein